MRTPLPMNYHFLPLRSFQYEALPSEAMSTAEQLETFFLLGLREPLLRARVSRSLACYKQSMLLRSADHPGFFRELKVSQMPGSGGCAASGNLPQAAARRPSQLSGIPDFGSACGRTPPVPSGVSGRSREDDSANRCALTREKPSLCDPLLLWICTCSSIWSASSSSGTS